MIQRLAVVTILSGHPLQREVELNWRQTLASLIDPERFPRGELGADRGGFDAEGDDPEGDPDFGEPSDHQGCHSAGDHGRLTSVCRTAAATWHMRALRIPPDPVCGIASPSPRRRDARGPEHLRALGAVSRRRASSPC
jgi:hypothetical protein